MDAFYGTADVLDSIAAKQIFHVGPCQPPVAVNSLISHRYIDEIVPAAADGADILQFVIIFKDGHQPGDSSFYRRFINDSGFRKPILGQGRSIVGYHDGNGPFVRFFLFQPFPGKVALYFAVFFFPLIDSGNIRITVFFCIFFGLFFVLITIVSVYIIFFQSFVRRGVARGI